MEKRSRAEYRRNSRNVSKVPYEYGSAVRQLNIAEPLKPQMNPSRHRRKSTEK